jgi:hypothetical protein
LCVLRWIRARLSYANVVASIALVIALGGSAYAATGGPFVGSNGAVNGCVPKSGGTFKVLKPFKKCPKHTVALSFNVNGQAGAAGKNGATGPTGSAGAPGSTGAVGPTVGNAAGGVDPPVVGSTETSVKTATVTTTVAGSLYVSGSLTASLTNCTPSICTFNFGLYVDGNPVAGTDVQMGFPVNATGIGYQALSMVGIVNGVTPGVHTVDLREISNSSNGFGLFNETGFTVGGILLGS